MTTKRTTLDAEQRETWRAYFDTTRLLLDELDRKLRDESDLPLADYALLARLADADVWGLRMSELADTAVYSRSRISHAVDRLESLGWVERRACPTDRRGSYASLTEKGREKLEQSRVTHDAVLQTHLLSPMTHEQMNGLRTAMDALKASLEGRETHVVVPPKDGAST